MYGNFFQGFLPTKEVEIVFLELGQDELYKTRNSRPLISSSTLYSTYKYSPSLNLRAKQHLKRYENSSIVQNVKEHEQSRKMLY